MDKSNTDANSWIPLGDLTPFFKDVYYKKAFSNWTQPSLKSYIKLYRLVFSILNPGFLKWWWRPQRSSASLLVNTTGQKCPSWLFTVAVHWLTALWSLPHWHLTRLLSSLLEVWTTSFLHQHLYYPQLQLKSQLHLVRVNRYRGKKNKQQLGVGVPV